MQTLDTHPARRPLAILALGAMLVAGLLTMASTGVGMAKSTTTTTRVQEDEPGWNCVTNGNHVCGALVDGKPATGADLDRMRQTAKDAIKPAPGETCEPIGPQYWGPGNTLPYGFMVACRTIAPAPVPVVPKVTG